MKDKENLFALACLPVQCTGSTILVRAGDDSG